jgi:hypothetical protein
MIFIRVAALLVLVPTILSNSLPLPNPVCKYPFFMKGLRGEIIVALDAVSSSILKENYCPLKDKYFQNEEEKGARLRWEQYCGTSDYIVDHGGDIELLCTMTPYC